MKYVTIEMQKTDVEMSVRQLTRLVERFEFEINQSGKSSLSHEYR